MLRVAFLDRALLFALLAGGNIACSETSGLEPIPEWAKDSDWSGTVVMKTGAVLTASFTLIEDVGTTFTGGRYRSIAITADKLENRAAGLETTGFLGSVDPDRRTIRIHFPTDAPFGRQIDGSPAPCPGTTPGVIAHPGYYLEMQLRNDRTFSGVLEFACVPPQPPLDSQPITVARIN